MRNLRYSSLTLCGIIIALNATSQTQTDTKYLKTQMPAKWEYTSQISSDRPAEEGWWKVFDDELLDSLITEGLKNNYDVGMAVRRINIAESQVKQAMASYYPSFSLDLGYTKARTAGAMAGTGVRSSNSGYFSAGVDMSWEIDLFGKITAKVKDQKALRNVSKADYDGVMLSLSAQIASNYINLRTYQEELKVTQEYMESQAIVVNKANARFEAGLVAKLDVVQAKTVYYSTQASVPKLQVSIEHTVNAIATLLGCYPEQIKERLLEYRQLPDYVHIVPSGIPAELLRRRPDIIEAEYQIASYAAELGIAKKDFLPTLSLNGSFGLAAHDFSALGKGNSIEYSVAPTLSWTIFDGLSRKYAVRAAAEQMENGIDNYNLTVMTAVEEVNNAMVNYTSTLKAIESYKDALAQSTESFDLSVDLYTQGLTAFTNVVDAQINTLTYANSLITAKGDALNSLINLYKALGGSPTPSL